MYCSSSPFSSLGTPETTQTPNHTLAEHREYIHEKVRLLSQSGDKMDERYPFLDDTLDKTFSIFCCFTKFYLQCMLLNLDINQTASLGKMKDVLWEVWRISS